MTVQPAARHVRYYGLPLVVVGVALFMASVLPIPAFDDHRLNDFVELLGTAHIALGASLIVRSLSRHRYAINFFYLGAGLLTVARFLDFTEEFVTIAAVPIIGGEAPFQNELKQITETCGYTSMLLMFISVLYELADARGHIEAEHRRYRDLHESSVLLARVADMAADAVIGLDLTGAVRTWNGGAQRLFGYPLDAIRGVALGDLLSHGLPAFDERLIERLVSEPETHIEVTARRATGETFAAGAALSIVFDGQDKPVGVSATVRDIEKQKQAERRLILARNILAQALEGADVGAFIAGADDEVIEVNPKLTEIVGVPRNRIASLSELAGEVCDPKARVLETIREGVFGRGEAVTLRDIKIRQPGGAVRTANLSVSPVRRDDGRTIACAGIMVDLTDREVLQHRLLQSQKMESIGRLAGGIAHDFNNILGAVLGYASLLSQILPPDTAERRYARAIEDSAARAADLTKQLLTFARGGEQVLRQVSLNEVVEETLGLFAAGSAAPNVRFHFERGEGLWAVTGDATQLHQVVLNLCINARDAVGDDGDIWVRTRNLTADEARRSKLPDERVGEFAVLTVEDNGCGMTPEVLQRAYEPFFSTKETGSGYGLGMSVVYGIVQAHRGAMQIDSAVGLGTKIEIFLPAAQQTTAAPPVPAPAPVILPGSGSETLLVVDDEKLIRSLVQDIFGGRGYSVLEAESGEQAIELFHDKGGKIDVVILDLVMPGMGGAQTLKRMLSLDPEVRVIVSSGYSNDFVDPEEIHSANVRVVQKPYLASRLMQEVRDLIDA